MTPLRRSARERSTDAVEAVVALGRYGPWLAIGVALLQWGAGKGLRALGSPGRAVAAPTDLLLTFLFGVVMVTVANVALLARARGKELTAGQLARQACGRLGWAAWVWIAAWLGLVGFGIVIGVACASFLPGVDPRLLAGGIMLATLPGFFAVGSIALAVAAQDDEVGEPVSRALRLVRLAPFRAMGSTLATILSTFAVTVGVLAPVQALSGSLEAMGAVEQLQGELLTLITYNLCSLILSVHGSLLYFELRRASEPGWLAFAPPDLVGGPPRCAAPTVPGGWGETLAVLAVMGWALIPTLSLISDYAVGFGFGYGAAMSFLLAMPAAWLFTRWMFRRASRDVMRAIGPEPGIGHWLAGLVTGYFQLALCGFAFVFVNTFLQGLISWFMTPAPTFALELWMDLTNAVTAAIKAACLTCLFAPLLLRREPRVD